MRTGRERIVSNEPVLKAIDLCCGAGGWACAARGLPIEIVAAVAAVDCWDVCCLTYAQNHPDTEVILRDITDPEFQSWVRELKGIDLVLGAIPCEWLSVRRSICGVKPDEIERGRQVLDAALAAVAVVRPAYWCLEDVIQLRRELPPFTPYLVLDSSNWSGQRRKRLYVGRFPRPKQGGNRSMFRDYLRPGPYRIGRRTLGRRLVYKDAFAPDKAFAARADRKGPTVAATSSRRDAELVVVDGEAAPRQLEWQEAAALQGFPLDYVFVGSPSDCWKMIGQAVQIDTGRAILGAIVHEAHRRRPRLAKNLPNRAVSVTLGGGGLGRCPDLFGGPPSAQLPGRPDLNSPLSSR